MPTAWPPAPFDVAHRHMDEWNAWYVGNADELANLYGNTVPRTRPSQYRGGLVGAVSRFFWGRPAPAAARPSRLHVPLASDIATASADLLFAEPPRITVNGTATQDRLNKILHSPLVHSGLLESAEVAAALGGVYLRVVWDADLAAHPMIDAVHADAAVPEWRWSQLAAVTFWSVVAEDGNTVWRHLERHEPGRIVHSLHVGSTTELGVARDLRDHPATAWVADVADDAGAIATGTRRLTAAYVPNVRPSREWRGKPGLSPLGRSDYDTVEPLFDAIDEVFSSWMRDIRLAKARLIVPTGYLDNNGPGQGASFDDDRELFTEINAMSRGDSGPEITLSQFAIRVAEHRETVDELVRAALRSSGYSPATFGDQDGDTSITATEVTSRERSSNRTRSKKSLYWQAGLSTITAALLDVDRTHFGGPGIGDEQSVVSFPERSQPDPEALARTAEALYRAEAASTEVRVRMVHPDWGEPEVTAEVARIRSEAGAVEPDPAEILRQTAAEQ